jgi:hypothetical protein
VRTHRARDEFYLAGRETKTLWCACVVPDGETAEANARVTSTRGGVADAPVRIER